jgi:hypothetical protein
MKFRFYLSKGFDVSNNSQFLSKVVCRLKFASKNEHDKNNKKCTIVFPDRKERLKITKPKMQSQCIWLVTDYVYASTDSCTFDVSNNSQFLSKVVCRLKLEIMQWHARFDIHPFVTLLQSHPPEKSITSLSSMCLKIW